MEKRINSVSHFTVAVPGSGMGARQLCLSLFLTFWGAMAVAQPAAGNASLSASANLYPAGSIRTVEQADHALADVNRERGEIESRYRAEEQACHPTFFATSCIERAQERRRKATMELRAIEVEANVLKRRVRLEERDKALAERNSKAESDRMERAEQHEEAANAPADAPSPTESPEAAKRKPGLNLNSNRKERHDARMARLRAEEAENAKDRAANVAEYEQKVQASKDRQEEVARRKAEKQRKRVLKQPSTPAPQIPVQAPQ